MEDRADVTVLLAWRVSGSCSPDMIRPEFGRFEVTWPAARPAGDGEEVRDIRGDACPLDLPSMPGRNGLEALIATPAPLGIV